MSRAQPWLDGQIGHVITPDCEVFFNLYYMSCQI